MRTMGTTATVMISSWIMLALCVIWAAVQA
jgi:hypothetical protein